MKKSCTILQAVLVNKISLTRGVPVVKITELHFWSSAVSSSVNGVNKTCFSMTDRLKRYAYFLYVQNYV